MSLQCFRRVRVVCLMIGFSLFLVLEKTHAQDLTSDNVFQSEEQTRIATDKKPVTFELPKTEADYHLAKRFFATAVKAGDL